MTTDERIATLEARVALLEAQITALLSRPIYVPTPTLPQYPQMPWQSPWSVGTPYAISNTTGGHTP